MFVVSKPPKLCPKVPAHVVFVEMLANLQSLTRCWKLQHKLVLQKDLVRSEIQTHSQTLQNHDLYRCQFRSEK